MALTKVSTGMLSADAASVDLNIDANTLFIDASANRVGVANTSPATALDVTGTASATNVSLPDDGVLSLGSSDELTIKHHNSGYSHLINTTGTLFIDSDSVTFRDDDGSPSNMVVSQTGIDVTGTVTTDGLTSAGDVAITGGSSGSTVLTLTTNALADTPLMVFQRTGGAIAGKLAYEDGNTAMSFGTTTAHELKFLTGGTSRLEIDSSGNSTFSGTVTATKLASANGVLELDDNGTHNGVINAPATLFINIDSDANSTGEDFIVGKDRTGTSGGTELFRIESEGRVGIFNSSPGNYTGSGSNSLVLGNSSSTTGSHGMTIVAGNQATSSIAFSDHDGDGGTSDYRGLFQYAHADDSLRVFTASGERFRIMSGGDARFTLSANAVGSFQDNISEVTDGTFCLQVANDAQSALKPLGFRAEDIRFATSAGERVRILSTGGITFNGDTASANALDDYEEGTWTPTAYVGSTQQSISVARSSYTKIGDLVTVNFSIGASANFTNSNTAMEIRGLPFASSGTAHEDTGSLMVDGLNWDSAHTYLVLYKYSGDANDAVLIYKSGDNIGWETLNGAEVAQNNNFIGQITYRTA